ncbi:MAG: hypothetical protein IPK60_06110 [Sandaracinaceae bacterium]|nr:hypothetical protein [Sandaracinaceae bacterium]
MKLSLTSLAVALLLAACGGEDPPGNTVDAGPEMLDPVAAYTREGVAATLDLSCQGVATAPPTDGAATSFTLLTKDYQTGDSLTNIGINFYPDNDVPADLSCAGSCVSGTSAANSQIPATGNLGAWFAYHAPGRDCDAMPTLCSNAATTPVTTVQYNIPVPAEAETHNANVVSLATLNLIPSVLGVSRQGGTGLIAGAFLDCQEHVLSNMQVRVYRPDGTFIVAPPAAHTSPAYRYFDGNNNPDATQKHTNEDGLFGALNMPVPTDGAEIRIEGWGNVDGELHMISCENARIFADGVTIMNVRPDRADGPSNCSE